MSELINDHDLNQNNLTEVDPDDNFFDSLFPSLNMDRQSSYYSIQAYNNQFVRNDCLTMVSANIRSLNAHYDEFISFLNSFRHMPDILSFSETWLRMSEAHLLAIDGYVGYHTCRPTARGGGVSVYVCERYTSGRIDALCVADETVELCTVRDGQYLNTLYLNTVFKYISCIYTCISNTFG